MIESLCLVWNKVAITASNFSLFYVSYVLNNQPSLDSSKKEYSTTYFGSLDMSFYRNIIYAITELDKNSNEKPNKITDLKI